MKTAPRAFARLPDYRRRQILLEPKDHTRHSNFKWQSQAAAGGCNISMSNAFALRTQLPLVATQRLGFAPRPALGGATARPPNPLAVFRGFCCRSLGNPSHFLIRHLLCQPIFACSAPLLMGWGGEFFDHFFSFEGLYLRAVWPPRSAPPHQTAVLNLYHKCNMRRSVKNTHTAAPRLTTNL